MLRFLIDVVALLFLFAVQLALAVEWTRRGRRRLLWAVFLFSAALSVIAAGVLYGLRRMNAKKMLVFLTALNRQAMVLAGLLVFVAGLLFMAFVLRHMFRKQEKEADTSCSCFALSSIFLSCSLIPMGAYVLPQLLSKTGEFVAFGEDSIGTDSFFRFGGYVLGVLLVLLMGISIVQLLRRLPIRWFRLCGGLLLLALFAELLVRSISSAARLHWIPSSIPWVFEILIFEDKSLPYAVGLHFLLLLFIVILAVSSIWILRGPFKHQAARRKALWLRRQSRRWALAAIIFSGISVLCLTWVQAYVNRPVELVAAEGYQSTDQEIIVPLTQVEDGHLHRFSYEYEGHNIRFIVVRKPNSNAYGVGLDACDICGIAGYYERSNTVVCKRCDVVMNKATIGFKGGCNPVPFDYVVKDGKITIRKAVLQKEMNRFPIGE